MAGKGISEPGPIRERIRPDEASSWSMRRIALGLFPLILLAGVLAVILATNAGVPERDAPPIEELSVERVTLPEPDVIQMDVVNDGPDPITVAQVLVDDAYWNFTVEGDATLGRFESTRITIPYPWVEEEEHHIAFISRNGVVFEQDVAVALESPSMDSATILRFALIGLYVGVIPVGLGLLWYPFLRQMSRTGMRFILALTIGLLVFLVIDMFEEGLQVAAAAPSALDGQLLLPAVAFLTFLLLMTIAAKSARKEDETGLNLAYRIAFGIGLHNLGEGLAIGAAFALGEIALGVFLILGFTLHNVTEGVGIAAPILRQRPAFLHFVGLVALAGLPAVVGIWIGGFIFSAFWTTIFLAVGIGAIAQVIVEVGRLLLREREDVTESALDWASFSGVTAGMLIMYGTALIIAG